MQMSCVCSCASWAHYMYLAEDFALVGPILDKLHEIRHCRRHNAAVQTFGKDRFSPILRLWAIHKPAKIDLFWQRDLSRQCGGCCCISYCCIHRLARDWTCLQMQADSYLR